MAWSSFESFKSSQDLHSHCNIDGYLFVSVTWNLDVVKNSRWNPQKLFNSSGFLSCEKLLESSKFGMLFPIIKQ